MDTERPSEEPRRRGRRRRGLLLTLFVGGLLAGGAVAAMILTRPGQRLVLGAMLDRFRENLAGSLTVQEIRSPSLLFGATLIGLRLDAEGDRPFLEVDSVEVRYSMLSLLGARPRLRGLTLWGPRVVISRFAGEEGSNVTRLVKPGPPSPDSAQPGQSIGLGTVRIEGGLLEVLTPAAPGISARVPTVSDPTGEGRLRRLALEDMRLELDDALLFDQDGNLFAGRLTQLATDVGIFTDPLRINRVQGSLTFGAQGLSIRDAAFRLPDSSLDGELFLGPEQGGESSWGFHVALRTDGPAALADLRWLDARIPTGTLEGGIGVELDGGVIVHLEGADIGLEASRLAVDGDVVVGRRLSLRGLDVRASPVALSRLEPWLGRDIPVDGWLSGRMILSGTMDELRTGARVTLVPAGHGGRPTTADLQGLLHFGVNPGVTDLTARVDPFNFEILSALQPAFAVPGDGSIRLEASGRVDDGVRFSVDVAHGPGGATASRILARGATRRAEDGRWVSDVQGDLAPLSLEMMAGWAPGLSLRGGIQGPVRAVGPWEALRVSGDLRAGGGDLTVDAVLDMTDLSRRYLLTAEASGVDLADLSDRVSVPSDWFGRLEVDAGGGRLQTLDGRGTLSVSGSRLGGLHVNDLEVNVSASGGILHIDTLSADLGDVRILGSGELGLIEARTGSARIDFDSESLLGLRSIFRGDTVLTRDGLTELQRRFLTMQGVDPDTLPVEADVAMDGALEGSLLIHGSASSMDVEGGLRLHRGVYGQDRLERANAWVVARNVTSSSRSVDLDLQAEGILIGGRTFAGVDAEVLLEGRRGEGTVAVVRGETERYDLAGAFTLHDEGGEVDLQVADLGLQEALWRLRRPTRIRWGPGLLAIEDLELAREDDDPMRLSAAGELSWVGASDFSADVSGLHLERLARVTQWTGPDVEGEVDLGVRVTGPAETPVIHGSVSVRDARYGHISFGNVSGRIDYRDRAADLRLEARDQGSQVFLAEGAVPVDLALAPEGSRVTEDAMDVSVRADGLDAAVLLSYLTFLEDQEGALTGDFHIGGPLDAPEPSGVLDLAGGAWTFEALGVRHRGVQGTLTLRPDRTVEVDLRGSSGGTATVAGTVVMDPLTNPTLDLGVTFSRFQAVDRRDVEGSISGQVRLLQTYERPLVEGSLRVDRGTLFLEEFARSAQVVDLSDPALLDDRFLQSADTAALSYRPLLAGMNNPFLQSLRVDVDLSVPRDSWLRSRDMNVEIGGQLEMTYDRASRDLVMVGELQALRGDYTVLGRRFQVEEGVVGFIGTPGINPTLDLRAVSRVRRREGEPLDVVATVSGNLTQPRVTLTSDEQGVAESDLVSYLIFGRPSYELASGREAFVGGAAGSLAGAATGFGVTWATGTLANQLSAAFAQQIGVDYLSITQTADLDVITGRASGSILAGTQVEVGQYIGSDIFFVLVFQPVARPGDSGVERFFGGARVEIALSDDYSAQGFWEDRFLRSGVGGFGGAIDPEEVWGVFIFREWGY
jgi:translocation and assembly module TamB